MEHTIARPFYRSSPPLTAKVKKDTSLVIADTSATAHKAQAARTLAAHPVSTQAQIQRKRRQDFRDVQQYIEQRMLYSERYNPYTLFL